MKQNREWRKLWQLFKLSFTYPKLNFIKTMMLKVSYFTPDPKIGFFCKVDMVAPNHCQCRLEQLTPLTWKCLYACLANRQETPEVHQDSGSEADKVLQLDPSQVMICQSLMVMFTVAPRHLFDLNSFHHQELGSVLENSGSKSSKLNSVQTKKFITSYFKIFFPASSPSKVRHP